MYLTLFPVLAVLAPFNLAKLSSPRCMTCDDAVSFSISMKSSVKSMRNIRTRSARAGSCLVVFSKRPEGTLADAKDFCGVIIWRLTLRWLGEGTKGFLGDGNSALEAVEGWRGLAPCGLSEVGRCTGGGGGTRTRGPSKNWAEARGLGKNRLVLASLIRSRIVGCLGRKGNIGGAGFLIAADVMLSEKP